MIRKITLQNFMSHRHTVIEPANGLTVLVGENNCGKSAVVAALQILCHNTGGDYMVRHGEKECRIIVETDEGYVVEWKRKNGTVSYTLNGKAIHRLRGGVPDDLHKLLRVPKVYPQDGGDPFDIHFGEQKKPVFLLDESGSRAAKFFASSSDAEALIKMQILHRSNVRDASQRSNQLQKELKTLDHRLEPLTKVADIQTQLDKLENQYGTLVANRKKAETLHQGIEDLCKAIDQAHQLEAETTILGNLKTPPRMGDTNSLSDLITSLDVWLKQISLFEHQQQTLDDLQAPPKLAVTETLEVLTWNMAQVSHDVQRVSDVTLTLSNLDAPPELAPVKDLEITLEQMENCFNELRYQSEMADCFARLDSPPESFDTSSLNELIQRIEITSAWALRSQAQANTLGRCKVPPDMRNESAIIDLIDNLERTGANVVMRFSVCEVLDDLAYPPSLIDPQTLESIVTKIDMLQREVRKCKNKLDQATISATKAEEALRDWVSENRICPTCGARLDPDRLVTKAITTPGGHIHE